MTDVLYTTFVFESMKLHTQIFLTIGISLGLEKAKIQVWDPHMIDDWLVVWKNDLSFFASKTSLEMVVLNEFPVCNTLVCDVRAYIFFSLIMNRYFWVLNGQ